MTDAERRRHMAHHCAFAILQGRPQYRHGMVFVAIVDEAPSHGGQLEVDASVLCGDALSEEGARMIEEFSRRLRAATLQIARDIADMTGATYIERTDLEKAAEEMEEMLADKERVS